MKLSSCRDLKQQVQGHAYRLAVDTIHQRTYKMRKVRGRPRRQVRTTEATPVAAVGVAPGQGKEYKLAIRIFRGSEQYQSELLRGLGKHMGEIDLATGVRYRPRLTMQAGGSIGHYKITAGTLGGFVEDDNNYYMMSNNHVFANSNQCFGGDPIVQPGPADATSDPLVVGHLDRWFPLDKIKRDSLDVALATFSDGVEFFEPWKYTGIGIIEKTPVSDRFSVTRVVKRGRTTGVRNGTVSAFELDGIQINYGTASDPAIITYDDQIEIIGSPSSREFSAPGDSGSFIIDRDTMQVYAMLYGGGPDAEGIDRTLAHFMPDVLKAMKVRLVQ